MHRLIDRIARNVRELGWKDAFFYMLCRILAVFRWRLFRYALVAQPVPEKPLLDPRRGASLTVREVAADDPAMKAMPLSPEVVAYRRQQGAHCLGLFHGEQMIGCLWFCLGPYDEDEVRCRFTPSPPERTAWDFDVYLHPKYRGGFGFLRLWDAGNAFLRERGRQWSCSRISAFNRSSILAHERMGARRLATATFLLFGTFQIMFASLSPYVRFSFRSGDLPTLILQTPSLDATGIRERTTAR